MCTIACPLLGAHGKVHVYELCSFCGHALTHPCRKQPKARGNLTSPCPCAPRSYCVQGQGERARILLKIGINAWIQSTCHLFTLGVFANSHGRRFAIFARVIRARVDLAHVQLVQ